MKVYEVFCKKEYLQEVLSHLNENESCFILLMENGNYKINFQQKHVFNEEDLNTWGA